MEGGVSQRERRRAETIAAAIPKGYPAINYTRVHLVSLQASANVAWRQFVSDVTLKITKSQAKNTRGLLMAFLAQ